MGLKKNEPFEIIAIKGFDLTPIGHQGKQLVTVNLHDESKPLQDQPDILVLALGFGVEQTVNDLPRLSYWRLDPLDQVFLSSRDNVCRVLVVGTGDGGATDFLRAALRNFDHGPFIDCVCQLLEPWAGEIRTSSKNPACQPRL